MNFQEFVGAAEVHLRMTGWLMRGHNGYWRTYKKPGASEAHPLPAAVIRQLEDDGLFAPTVEDYLVSCGWRRSTGGVVAGWSIYMKDGKYRNLPVALLQQLRDDRLDRAVVEPQTTPSGMRNLLMEGTLRSNSSPPPSGQANTAPARR